MSLFRKEDCHFGTESALRVEMQWLLLDEAVARLTIVSVRKVADV